ncbi:homeobox protein cut isoform X4 [Ostrinia furnacalis]|uniref:homeobox protein cut isoform X3 n=1 Tax=Ostrinia furnacalis TaxID=93504 RepID=UPI00103E8ED2|nr:homeobox protein cut isoform X3 [Ostrinia furnacalis]XP_028166699.1 homeobox protein cut isoform X4 [Ostrinia furnacalis]
MHPTGAASLPAPEAEVQAMHSMDWLFKKERIYLLAQFWQQRATLAEKEVTTLKEQLATTSPTPLQATVPLKTNGSLDSRDQATETRIPDIFDIKEEKRRSPELDEDVEQKMEMAATGRSNSNSSRSSPVVHPSSNLENELAAKEKEIAQLVEDVRRLQASLAALQDAHAQQLARLEERLDEKKQHIARLEARIDAQRDYDDIKREISMLRALDLGAGERSLERKPEPLRSPAIAPPMRDERNSAERERSSERRDTGAEEWPSTPPPLNNNTTHHNNNGPLPLPPPSPFRFDEHRPYRFAEDMGPLPPGALVGRLGDSLIPKGDPMEARLQEMLRYNMDKYANTNLDTLHISRRVRELLSVHNIGQRLFAKYVLGLSQGTVSELLSKPKPWDKLTEKGRDSYRKMHAWACDEAAVMLLKSLIPKKVGTKDGTGAGFGRPEGEGDERLAHILSEASHLMKPSAPTNDDSRSNEDSSSPRTQCPSPFSNKDSSQNRRLKKYENDDIPQEKVVRIYQEELAKIMTRRVEDMRHSRDGFPTGGMPPHMERPPEDIRMALEAYHRELAKLQPGGAMPSLQHMQGMPPFPNLLALQQQAMQQAQNQHMNGSGAVQDLSLPKDKNAKMNGMTDSDKDRPMDAEEAIRHAGSAFSLVRPKLEPGQQSTGSSASSPLGNAILPPAITPNDDFSSSAAASPLQRMASITNSLISQPTNPTHHQPPQRSMKAVLPPITQQQFDLFNNLNTEDIVRRVKEALSQYSISQRLFGESVLGLSQGSVSDLLARPKPWHMLTQKGREPFIRMKMFLEDDNAVHKLVASQYKIAPEKLMRTGNYSGVPPCPPNMTKPMPPTQKMISDATSLLSKMQQEQLLGPGHLGHLGQPTPLLLTPPGFPPHHAVTLPPQHHDNNNKERKPPPPPQPHHPPGVMRNLHQHISPSVYEMAALTQDLDTQTITTKIKEALLANNIGQKIFGEAVLGLSQGSVSELLSKPKPWHMLSIKGREPFIRMQLWLSDAHNIDRLQALKNERREANKRRRSSGPGQDNSSDTSSNDTSEFYHSSSPGPTSGAPSAKKQRVLFSEEQKEALRLAFALDPYPNMPTIEFLATELGLSTRTITNWFHNHRMRLKQQAPHGLPAEPPVRDQSSAPFDPVQFRLLLNQRLLELQKERMGLAGVPLPYPPYFAANSNLAALIGRGLLPPDDHVKDQSGGLDLSMPLKREPDGDDFEDDDVESNLGSEDSLDDGESKTEPKAASTPAGRSSRRKPAAPQWVNPDWQDEKPRNPDEVIINGVCVMRSDDFRREAEETVRVEPAPVARDGSPAASPAPRTPLTPHTPHTPHTPRPPHTPPEDVLSEDKIKTETEDDRWEY